MTIDAFPCTLIPPPAEAEFFMIDTTGSVVTYSGASYEAIYPGARFSQILHWPLIDGENRDILLSFLTRQRGPAGRFRCVVYDYTFTGGQVGGTIEVQGFPQLGNTLQVTGLAGTNPVLRRGNMIAYGPDIRHLGVVRQNVNISDGAIIIDPEIYESPGNGSAVRHRGFYENPNFPVEPVWQLPSNDAVRRSTRSPMKSSITVTMVTAPTGQGI